MKRKYTKEIVAGLKELNQKYTYAHQRSNESYEPGDASDSNHHGILKQGKITLPCLPSVDSQDGNENISRISSSPLGGSEKRPLSLFFLRGYCLRSLRNSPGVTMGMLWKAFNMSRSLSLLTIQFAPSNAHSSIFWSSVSRQIVTRWRGVTNFAWALMISVRLYTASGIRMLRNLVRRATSRSSSKSSGEIMRLNALSFRHNRISRFEGEPNRPLRNTLVSTTAFSIKFFAGKLYFPVDLLLAYRIFLASFINSFKKVIPSLAQSFLFKLTYKTKFLFNSQVFHNAFYLFRVKLNSYFRHLKHLLYILKYNIQYTQSQLIELKRYFPRFIGARLIEKMGQAAFSGSSPLGENDPALFSWSKQSLLSFSPTGTQKENRTVPVSVSINSSPLDDGAKQRMYMARKIISHGHSGNESFPVFDKLLRISTELIYIARIIAKRITG